MGTVTVHILHALVSHALVLKALQLAALVAAAHSCSRFAARKWHMRLSSGSHAGAKGSRVRARSGACWGGSCVAGMLAPRVAILLARLRLFLPLVGRTRPSPARCFLTVASPCFRVAAPGCKLGLSKDVTSSFAKRKMGSPDFGAHNSKTRPADCCQRQVCGRPVEPVGLLLHRRL